tara:strand:- start:519 stop:851 length:333 start_codon:yes stop_codon:yes gene_type:complete
MKKLSPLANKIILINLDSGLRKSNGVILLDDDTADAGSRGIRPRWAEVYAVGPEQLDVAAGDWVLMDHGRWSVGQNLRLADDTNLRFWLGDPDGIIGVSTTGKPDELQEV